ncbi:unnamed protein product [Prorocentrum cordatum]|uniref:Uncharacterized protein n=1 Tax=Prorocentrum cordatum TaxID=2364126 RepID=A0ABN9UUA8_9DINO|nr:unnamed protein product [Polarella glacialis]
MARQVVIPAGGERLGALVPAGLGLARRAAAAPAAEDEEAALPPEGAVTAGQADRGSKKRGGVAKTGSKSEMRLHCVRDERRLREFAENHIILMFAIPGRRKEKAGQDGEEGKEGEPKRPGKKRKEDKDPDRWIKMQLQGEGKPKVIDATRVVSYFDFDSRGALFDRASLPAFCHPDAA